MAIIHADGFDHWGTGTAIPQSNMLLGTYGNVSNTINITAANARTGNCVLCPSHSNDGASLLLSLPIVNTQTVTVGFAIYLANYPQINTFFQIPRFVDTNLNALAQLGITASGQLYPYILFNLRPSTPGPVIPNGAYSYVECQIVTSSSGGNITCSMIVRVNGVVVLTDTVTQVIGGFNVNIAQVVLGLVCTNVNTTPVVYFDDYYVTNGIGPNNQGFLGDRRCRTLMPTADTSQADWTKNSGTVGFNRINEIPEDGDTTFIQAATVGNKSNFGFATVPGNTADIAGVVLYNMMKKSDAGPCNVQAAIIANASTANGTSYPITTAYNYYRDVIERDGTGAQFTQTTINAGLLSLTRTA